MSPMTTTLNNEKKRVLPEADLPKTYYNIQADLPEPLPPVLHPGHGGPIGPDDLAPLFPMELIRQEVSTERRVEIPEQVREIYRLWRPTPLVRAMNLERALGTPAKIYFKNESVSPAGSHKPNTAVPQVFYNSQAGIRKLTTETGAGQWGSSLAFAASHFDMDVEVYMVRASYDQKPYRRGMIETYGGTIHPSPSDRTEAGRAILAESPDSPGSLGIAISEAVELAAKREDTNYALGSVLNHVLLHQTVIGEETKTVMEREDLYPDVVIGCVGGGSNFAGIAFPFLRDTLVEGRRTRFVAVEPEATPSLTRGQYRYDFGDTAGMTPLMKMYTLGHSFVPAPIHAGGLRYHGMAPLVCHLYDLGLIEAVAVPQSSIFEAGLLFARTEGIIPAPESNHAVRVAIDEALKCRETGEEKVILFELSGHGHFDMAAYDAYLKGQIVDTAFQQADVDRAMAALPQVG